LPVVDRSGAAATLVGAAGGTHPETVWLPPVEHVVPHEFVTFTKHTYAVLAVRPVTVYDVVVPMLVPVVRALPTGALEHVPPVATQNTSRAVTIGSVTALHDTASELVPAATVGVAGADGGAEHAGVGFGVGVTGGVVVGLGLVGLGLVGLGLVGLGLVGLGLVGLGLVGLGLVGLGLGLFSVTVFSANEAGSDFPSPSVPATENEYTLDGFNAFSVNGHE